MKTPIHHILFASLAALVFIGCSEDNDQPSTLYNPRNAEINEPITWHATDSVVIDCILLVNSTVTIEAGATVRFTENGYLKVGLQKNGAIVAMGTAQKPIRFTYQSNTLTSDIQSGSWYGIYFGQRNLVNTTKLRYCSFEGAGKGNTPCIELNKTTLDMESCTISNSAGAGIRITGASSGFTSFSNNTLNTCGSYLLDGTLESLAFLDNTNTLTPTNDKGIAIRGGDITIDCTLTKQTLPYTILGNLYIDNAVLTVESGTTLEFSDRTSLNIGRSYPASLIAIGTSTEPILFTSAATNPHPGDWQGLVFHTNNMSTLTVIKHAIIDYAGQSVDANEGAINTFTNLRVENTIIRNSLTYGLYCNSDVSISNFVRNTIQACNEYPISIHVDQAHTIDSTNVYTNNAPTYNFINLKGTQLTSEVRWKKQGIPYLILENLTISNTEGKAKLTLAKGCTVALANSIIVGKNGCLSAIGTEEDSITITSSSDIPAPGDWTSIEFTKSCGTGNELSYCKIEYGGYFSDYMVGISSSNVSLTNCSIRNSLMHGIYLYRVLPPASPYLSNNSFYGNGGDDVHTATEITF